MTKPPSILSSILANLFIGTENVSTSLGTRVSAECSYSFGEGGSVGNNGSLDMVDICQVSRVSGWPEVL
jgi:hypothetical protein